MICHHRPGNRIFGIKFKVSPIVLEKKVNFSEYRESVHPLSYLMDAAIVRQVKAAGTFDRRIELVSGYYQDIIDHHSQAHGPVKLVTRLLKEASEQRNFNATIQTLAAGYGVSARTLQRYFLATTGITGKQALQIIRIRMAAALLATDPQAFRYEDFGYYDYSHFHKHLKSFLNRHYIGLASAHLHLLQKQSP